MPSTFLIAVIKSKVFRNFPAYKIPTAGLRLDRMNVTEDGILFDRTPLGAWAEGLEGGNQGISSYPLKEGHENRGEKTCISD